MRSDDHGWEEPGYNGHSHVKTPVLDQMARTGLLAGWRPAVTDDDYRGAWSIIVGEHRPIMQEPKNGPAKVDLFDLKADPAAKPGLAQHFQTRLHAR